MTTCSVHPLGKQARILLSGVFGPYAQDDEFGSRTINPMELYHNQVTRVQGAFSLRMFHRSFGLMLLQSNLDAPCTLLDFPSLDRFVQELCHGAYDIVGISGIVANVGKVKKMCELVRKHLPEATIVVGGHIANLPGIEIRIDADHIVKGDGVRWFRGLLGQDVGAPVRHPQAYSAFGSRTMGVKLRNKPGDTAAILIPSVGCPVGCNFCSTSALFGGKGNFFNFYETGDELFQVMCQLEKNLSIESFFVLDENFLLHRKRALRLLELMEENQKSWGISVFSSARVLQSYTIDQLVGLGINWVWMGMEGESSQYRKLKDVDTRSLVAKLQSHGIRVLGSSIIGMENHTQENMAQVIDFAVSHGTDFHQFMLYTPVPGTPLYEQHRTAGTLLSDKDFPLADAHGQYRFNYRHPHIHDNQEETFLLDAFQKDFEINGPSLARLIRTTLRGWQRYQDHPDRRIQRRMAREAKPLRTTYAGAVWAMRKWYRHSPELKKMLDSLLRDIYRTFGWQTRAVASVIGRYLLAMLGREEKRLAAGWTYEPALVCEKNDAAMALEKPAIRKREKKEYDRIRWVVGGPATAAAK